jgi:hypothetical protein
MSDKHNFNYHAYYDGPEDHEYQTDVPSLLRTDHQTVMIYVSKVGGGTVGKSYSGSWAWSCVIDGEETGHGDDLSTGMPKTHAETARLVADFLAGSYPEGSELYERFSMFGSGDSDD